MFLRRLVRSAAAALLILAGALVATHVHTRRAFTRFVPVLLPQHASGDFDGDGSLDTARIDPRQGAVISVHLSGAPDASSLPIPVAALIDSDIDHDGDLDLLATTASGDLIVWLNDGHGRFTRRPPTERRGVASMPTSVQVQHHTLGIIDTIVPPFSVGTRVSVAVVATRIRPPTAPSIVDRRLLLLQTLRAPPLVLA